MKVRSLEELKKLDDNGAFDRLVKEAEKRSNGDPSLIEVLLTESVLSAFVKAVRMDAIEQKEERPKKIVQQVPKKPRSTTVRATTRQSPPTYNSSSPSSSATTSHDIVNPRDHCTSSTCKRRRLFDNQEIGKKKKVAGNYYEEIKKNVTKRPKLLRPDTEELKRQGYCLELPEEVKCLVRRMEGTEPVMLILRFVFSTDLSDRHLRFNMPEKQLEVKRGDRRFSTEEEDGVLMGEGSVKMRLVEPGSLEVSEMDLRKWNMRRSDNFVLTAGWGRVMRKYRNTVLNRGEVVRVWAFRCNGGKDLWLALVVPERPATASVSGDNIGDGVVGEWI